MSYIDDLTTGAYWNGLKGRKLLRDNYKEFSTILKSTDYVQIRRVLEAFWREAFEDDLVPDVIEDAFPGASFPMKLLTLTPEQHEEQQKGLVRD